MKRLKIVVLNITNFQFIKKAHMEPTRWESLWRTYMQILGCVFVVSFMRYEEGKDTFRHFYINHLFCATHFLIGPVHSFYIDLLE